VDKEIVRSGGPYHTSICRRLTESVRRNLGDEELKKHQLIQKWQFDYRGKDRTFKHGDLVLILLPTSNYKLLMQ